MAYQEIMVKIVGIGGDVDRFFDKVLVICEDVGLKNNRLALLKEIREMFMKVGDFSRIVYEV
jgi:glycyl-tRNA synthetase beta chain